VITEPGLYRGIPEDVYHGDSDLAPELGRSLSQSGAKTLLAQGPERFAWERENGRPPKDAFDIGGLTHELVLRGGDNRIRIVDAYDWRTKAAQQAKRDAHKDRLTPCHRGDLLQASRVACAVKAHALAGPILSEGEPEVSLYWIDAETGVTCRGRIDWLRDNALVDLKTVGRYGDAVPAKFGRSAASFDYPMQAAFYSDGYYALTGVRLPFLTIAVELDPPHFVTVGWYSDDDLEIGRERMRQALAIYAERESSGVWADPPEIQTIPLPGYYGR
jgi:hypothetical protein